jgi:hypothetical protein
MWNGRNKTSDALPCRRLAVFLALAAGAMTLGSAPAAIDFNRDVRPILSDNCFACHGPDTATRKAGLRLDLKEEAFKPLESGEFAFVPGNPGRSKALKLAATENNDDRMPPEKTGKRLSAEHIDLLTRWIRDGAVWDEHWAYIPPTRPALPVVENSEWPRNPIDQFVLARLEKEGLKPAPGAGKTTLIRRVTIDLTGLPPSIEEVDAFLADESEEAYEKVVDRLLASARYGERMAVPWLDLARYADTSGYHFDGFRQMSIWRDWVIQAFNSNMPYDRFTIEQLAGDLLPNATREQKIATGFHRNVMTNDEGGADPDEYLSKYIVDRVNTTAAAWLGLTMSCAECHDHKYDRLSQKEYYQLYAFFHNVPEKGLDGTRVSNPAPKMQVPSPGQEAEMARLTGALSQAEQVLKTRESELPTAQEAWETELRATPPEPSEPPGLLALFSFDEHFSWTGGAESQPGQFKGAEQPEWVDGKLGRALKLDGGEAHLDAGQAVALERTNAFSYGAWVKLHARDGTLLSKMEAAPGHRGFDLIFEGGRLAAHLVHAWPENGIKVQTRDQLPTNRWLHVMMTYDGSSKAGGVKLFVNGKLQLMETKNDKLNATILSETALRIGRRIDGSRFNGWIDDIRFYERELEPKEVVALAAIPHLALVQVPANDRPEEHHSDLKEFFRMHFASDFIASQEEVASLKKARDDLNKAIPDTMVMVEMEKPRETFVFVRGDFQKKGERVYPDVPAVLPSLPADQPTNRLALARWLVSPEQPLTSRVTVNRFWQMFFGAGIVNTLNDFGAQGEWPSHPELLDWLAAEFMNPETARAPEVRPWDVKNLVRLIVTSSTYRQSAVISPEALERDPYNRLLSRGPRLRLEVEFIRDNALAISGLLNNKIGGPSIKPYQPPGIWTVTDHQYEQSKGEDLYRRGLYVFWKRAAHYPSFAAFDAPSRETCTLERPRTSTPLQSLVLMNDPVYVEAARAFGQRILDEGGEDVASRITFAFRTVLARPPSASEQAVLARAYEQQLELFRTDTSAAEELLKVGESPRREGADAVELAAWTTVANVLLNLNETITR